MHAYINYLIADIIYTTDMYLQNVALELITIHGKVAIA